MKIKYFVPKVWIFMLLIHVLSYSFLMVYPVQSAHAQSSSPRVESKAFNLTLKGLLSHSIDAISVDEIKDLDGYQVLDAREYEEYQVSHLPGGKWIGYEDFNPERLEKLNLDKDKPVLLYCSVGYRSEKIGERLETMGYKQVFNLYGGIFEWSNEEKPLLDKAENPTKKVHAYNKIWGAWVNKGEKVY